MFDWSGVAGAGLGILGGLLGPSGPPHELLDLYRQYSTALGQAMDLYKNTDLNQLDHIALGQYSRAVQDRALSMLDQYDARAASAGSPIYKSDTAKERARAGIAYDDAKDVAGKGYELDITRPQRQKALLPQPGEYSAGMSAASQLDAQAAARGNAFMDTLQKLGKMIPWDQIFRPRGGGQNDALGLVYHDPAMSYA